MKVYFEWDERKNQINIQKHHISFHDAQKAFLDPERIILKDIDHSTKKEDRLYCIGKIGDKVCTVRFTYRNNIVRIIGAGFWRKERRIYEKQKKER